MRLIFVAAIIMLCGCCLPPSDNENFRPGEIWPVSKPVPSHVDELAFWTKELERAKRRVRVCERLLNVALDNAVFCEIKLRQANQVKAQPCEPQIK